MPDWPAPKIAGVGDGVLVRFVAVSHPDTVARVNERFERSDQAACRSLAGYAAISVAANSDWLSIGQHDDRIVGESLTDEASQRVRSPHGFGATPLSSMHLPSRNQELVRHFNQ
jgi:hypothetical protein